MIKEFELANATHRVFHESLSSLHILDRLFKMCYLMILVLCNANIVIEDFEGAMLNSQQVGTMMGISFRFGFGQGDTANYDL